MMIIIEKVEIPFLNPRGGRALENTGEAGEVVGAAVVGVNDEVAAAEGSFDKSERYHSFISIEICEVVRRERRKKK